MRFYLGIVVVVMLPISCIGQTMFEEIAGAIDQAKFSGASYYGSGVSASDFDQDGDIDLFVPTEEGKINAIYINELGNFHRTNLISDNSNARAALWLDYNSDGLLDLFFAGDCYRSGSDCDFQSTHHLYTQVTFGQFVRQNTSLDLPTSTIDPLTVFGGAAAGDLNNDGCVDLILTYWNGSPIIQMNNCNGTFTDASGLLGEPLTRRYWQPVIYDFNQDGWADIFLSVDDEKNLFYRNNGGKLFEEMGQSLQLAYDGYDMGVSLSDYDNDGDMDLYVTNIFEASNHNRLFVNQLDAGSFRFLEKANALDIANGGWGWGNTFLDVNNDGFSDLVATNGWTDDFANDQSRLWINHNGVFFTEPSNSGFDDTLRGVSLIAFDADHDGDSDLLQTFLENPDNVGIRYLQNSMGSNEESNYLIIRPRMNGANRMAIGSTITVQIGDQIQTRAIISGNSFYGQEPAEASFGLASNELIDKVTVTWPGGQKSTRRNVISNQILDIDDLEVIHAPVIHSIDYSQGNHTVEFRHMSGTETGFLLQKSTFSDFLNFEEYDLTNGIWIAANIEPSVQYFFRVKAISNIMTSEWSAVASYVWNPDVIVNAPTDFQVDFTRKSSIGLGWGDNSNNESSFELQRSTKSDFNQYVSISIPQDQESFFDTTVEPDAIYYYRIRAMHPESASSFSNTTMACACDPLKESSSEILIFPNPSNGEIQILNGRVSNLTFRLFNLNGHMVKSKNLGISITNTINVSHLPSGLYIYQINDQKVIVKKNLILLR